MPDTDSEGTTPAMYELAASERAALIAAHERRLTAIRGSTQYRLGELLIGAARNRRQLLRLPRALWALRGELHDRRRSIASPPPATDAPVRGTTAVTVLDDFSHASFDPEWIQRPATAGASAPDLRGADLVFVESAWAGNGGAFRYDLAHYAKRDPSAVHRLLHEARAAGVPTVFWNKEDPVHFDTFIDAASGFDWVLTTDADCISRYHDELGHRRVAALPFAAQPRIHNPLGGPATRTARVCFAGSWQADQYADRGADIQLLLGPALDRGVLDIFDRHAAFDSIGSPFPFPYDRAVLGARSYHDLLTEYRRYAAFLNVNSVKTSPTMCSRRVFELLACRTPVISTRSRAIDELLGDAVITVDDRAEAAEAIELVTSDTVYRDVVAQRGYRAVMSRHTYGDRVDELLERLGLGSRTDRADVTVLTPTIRPAFIERVIENFSRQRAVDADLIVLTNSDQFDTSEIDARLAHTPRARAIHLPADLTMGECLNIGMDATSSRFIAKFDDDDHYGEWYLHDALLARRYAGAAIIGKKSFFAHLESTDETILRFPGNEFRYVDRVSGATLVIDRSIFTDARFSALSLGEDVDLCEQAIAAGHKILSTDRFNFVATRRAAPDHSWVIDDRAFRTDAVAIGDGLPWSSTMV